MPSEEAQLLRARIAELREQLARAETEVHDGRDRQFRFIMAHAQALEATIIALAIEIREEISAHDLVERVSARLSSISGPELRRLNTAESGRSADAVDSLASRLDQVRKSPRFEG